MDIEWALGELSTFLHITTLERPSQTPGVVDMTGRMNNRGTSAEIIAKAQVVEQILDRVIPDWRTTVPDRANSRVNRWVQHHEATQRAIVELDRREEIAEMLGENAPDLNAARLHPWVWSGARSLWQSGHYREAVHAAAIKVNAELQNKVGRRDVSETDLFRQVFTAEAPKPGAPRLRVTTDDGSQTFQSVQRGVMAFAEGCYAAIRNPASHVEGELDEDRALEQLASFSVLARWIDDATISTA